MAFIGRARLNAQPGQEPLSAVPDMVLELVDIRAAPDGLWRVIFWASGDDFDAYEAALGSSAEIADFAILTDLPQHRLYRVTMAEAVTEDVLHSVAVEHDVTLIDVTMTAEWLHFLARFPTREALAALRSACRARGMGFRLEHLYEERATAKDGGGRRYGVTEAQREALLLALDAGYFDVPRRTKLETIAGELGISTSALSTRLRRGQRSLLTHTLGMERTT